MVEVELGEGVHIGLHKDRERAQAGLDFVEQIGVGCFRQDCGLVVGLEGGFDVLGLVGEVEDQGARFLRVGAVEARERLYGVHAAELLVHVHGL